VTKKRRTCLEVTVVPDFLPTVFQSDLPTWVPDSHPKIFSSFNSSSWSYLNLKFDSPLHHAAGSQKKIVGWDSFNT
jgi:hypothetical protein